MLRLQKGHKYCLLGRLSSEVGWNHYDTIRVINIILCHFYFWTLHFHICKFLFYSMNNYFLKEIVNVDDDEQSVNEKIILQDDEYIMITLT